MKMEKLMSEMKNNQGLIIAIIASGLIFGFIVGRTMKEKEAGERLTNKAKQTITEEKETLTQNLSTVSVVKEQKAGKEVLIEKTNLTNDSWIVVRENSGGEMGNILGALWLPKGTANNSTIELLRETQPGKMYHVVIWNDNGDRIFSMTADAPILNNGRMITSTFVAN